MTRENFGYLARFVLGAFLILYGVLILVPVGIPAWVLALLAIAAGILVILGK